VGAPDGDADDDLTVDELARAAGTTTRNVRSYQTRGLLPPPAMRGRVGYYGRTHVARLRLIASLQARGYSLAAIGDLLEAWDERRTLGELLGLERELTSPTREEREEIVTRDELMAQFPMLDAGFELMSRVVELELVVPIPPDRRGRDRGGRERYRITSPRLLEVGRALLEAGIPAEAALDELAELRERARAIAGRFVALFTRYVWRPWVEAGQPMDSLPGLLDTVRRLKPMPGIAVSAVLAQALDEEVARVVAIELRDLESKRGTP
jgi:DNA-binding transcriptional MerR regulator